MSARIAVTGSALSLLLGVLAFAGLLAGAGSDGGATASGTFTVQVTDGPSGSLIWD